MLQMFANIIIDISHEKVDRPFQYKIPESILEQLEVGMCVEVPFGNGNHIRKGYVIEITEQPEFDPNKQKEIIQICNQEALVETKLIKLAWWMKKNYGSTMIAALKTVLPSGKKMKILEKKSITRMISADKASELSKVCESKHQNAKARVLRELEKEEILPYDLLVHKLNISASTLKSLERDGAIRIDSQSYYRNPVKMEAEKEERKRLSEGQLQIVEKITSDYQKDIRKTYLIHGITGSGKTEVYMEMISRIVQSGRQAVVLIPEIALTYQTVMRFYKRFGDRVSVMNSTLSSGEKSDQCERARKGDLDVIIGPRSALFTPFPNLGLIVIDEEHETSYKSETMPRYHARETAIELAKICHASVVLGSATPSLESYYRAQKGEYELFELKERLTGGSLPHVDTIDLREELQAGNRSIFSRRLKELIADRLEKKEQTMLFLNRRGYAGFVSCRACGYVVKCPHCDVSMSQHRGGKMICHYCGYEQPAVTKCPSCGSKYILGFRAGTQQIEELLSKEFPTARVLRMDADTTKTKESYEKILSAFSDGEADILVGTQMIVKGHDFPRVTLVGILAADLSLFANDYRAGERTFQLLTQAAGRAGRGTLPGEVVIQTYQPEHYSIIHAAKQDYEGFYEEEVLYRELLEYPPAAHMMAVLVVSKEEEEGLKLANELVEWLKGWIKENKDLQKADYRNRMVVIGPANAAISKINDIYRFIFYAKHPDYDTLTGAKDFLERQLDDKQLKRQQVYFDFDPMSNF